MRNFLDECYHKTLASSVTGPNSLLIVPLALAEIVQLNSIITSCRSLKEIGNIYPTLDQRLLRRFVEQHSYLIHITHKMVNNKHLLAFRVPSHLCNFFFDPDRCRSIYSPSWVLDKCQQAIKRFIGESGRIHDPSTPLFFTQTKFSSSLLEHVRNETDSNDLLLFLGYLSRIDWLNIYKYWAKRQLTHAIAHWVCTTLVGWFLATQFHDLLIHNLIQESSSLEPGDIRDAIYKVFTEIIPHGILPALSRQISWASKKLGIFESRSCLQCLWEWHDVPELDLYNFGLLSRQTVRMCTDQNFFQILCTRMVESTLLGRVIFIIFRTRYVFDLLAWKWLTVLYTQ